MSFSAAPSQDEQNANLPEVRDCIVCITDDRTIPDSEQDEVPDSDDPDRDEELAYLATILQPCLEQVEDDGSSQAPAFRNTQDQQDGNDLPSQTSPKAVGGASTDVDEVDSASPSPTSPARASPSPAPASPSPTSPAPAIQSISADTSLVSSTEGTSLDSIGTEADEREGIWEDEDIVIFQADVDHLSQNEEDATERNVEDSASETEDSGLVQDNEALDADGLPQDILDWEDAFPQDGIQQYDDEGNYVWTDYSDETMRQFRADHHEDIERYFAWLEGGLTYATETAQRVTWAEFSTLGEMARPLGYFWWDKLRRLEVGAIMALFRRGVPVQAAAVLGVPGVSLEDLSKLPTWDDQDLRNIWGNYWLLMVKTFQDIDIAIQSFQDLGIQGNPSGDKIQQLLSYLGQSANKVGIQERMGQHKTEFQRSPTTIRHNLRDVLIYKFGRADLSEDPAWETQHIWRCGFRVRKVDHLSPISGLHEAIRHAVFGLIQFEVEGRPRGRYSNKAVQDFVEGMRSAAAEKAGGVVPPIISAANRSFGFAESTGLKKRTSEKDSSQSCTFSGCQRVGRLRWQTGNFFSPLVCKYHWTYSPSNLGRPPCINANCGMPRRKGIYFSAGRCRACEAWHDRHAGQDRPTSLCHNDRTEEILCATCFEPMPKNAGTAGRCMPCFEIHRKGKVRSGRSWPTAAGIGARLKDEYHTYMLTLPTDAGKDNHGRWPEGHRCVNCFRPRHSSSGFRAKIMTCTTCILGKMPMIHQSFTFWDWVTDQYVNGPGALSIEQLVAEQVAQRPPGQRVLIDATAKRKDMDRTNALTAKKRARLRAAAAGEEVDDPASDDEAKPAKRRKTETSSQSKGKGKGKAPAVESNSSESKSKGKGKAVALMDSEASGPELESDSDDDTAPTRSTIATSRSRRGKQRRLLHPDLLSEEDE